MTQPIALGKNIRSQFPIFQHNVRKDGNRVLPLSYLDSGVTSQKPQVVIDAIKNFLERDYGSVHRGSYDLSVRASDIYERTREKTKLLFSASSAGIDVVFTRGATEGLNLLANGLAETLLSENSRIVTTVAEHHANMIPWQQMALRKNCELAYIPLVGQQGVDLRLNIEQAEKLISSNTRIVAIAHVGNVLGQENPLQAVIALAKNVGAVVVLDSAQSVSGFDTDLFAMGADAVVFSAHKMYGPSGIGAVVARSGLLRNMPPLQFGGGMISSVTLEESTWADAPSRFEAGTPPLMEVAGLSACIDWLKMVGRVRIHKHASHLAALFANELKKVSGVSLYYPGAGSETIVSFRHERIHAHDLATILDSENVAVRAGHHCAWPLIRFLGVDALVRASFGVYSDEDDVEAALRGIRKALALF